MSSAYLGTGTGTGARISLVMVTFHSSSVAPAAVASFRASVAELGASGEVVIVDHSEDAGEEERLRALTPELLLPRPNLGYAAGVNAGVAASSGETVLVGNPDVRFAPGALAALLGALGRGWDVVGPQFTLAGWLFPPSDVQTPGEQLRRWLASRSPALWRRQLGRELARWRAVWDGSGPVAVSALSGALLAFRRETFARVGPWDERYFLYFEETEWLSRAVASGTRLAQVPAARVEHAWGHAADPESTGSIFAASRLRFFSTRFGWRGRLAVSLSARALPFSLPPLPARADELPEGRLQWLLSPTALGLPAAGLLGTAADIGERLRAVSSARRMRARYVVLAAEPVGAAVIGAWSWEGRDG